MAVLKRGNRWSVDYYDRNGKRHRKNYPTKAEAEKQNRAINNWKRHDGAKPKGITLGSLLSDFLATRTNLSTVVQNQEKYTYPNTLGPILHLTPDQLSPAAFQPVREAMHAAPTRRGKDPSYSTIRHKEEAIRLFISYLRTQKFITATRDELYPLTKGKRPERMVTISPITAAKLKATAEADEMCILMLGYHTGARRQEIAYSQAGDWTSEGRLLTLRTAKKGGWRTVHADEELTAYLDRLTKGQDATRTLFEIACDDRTTTNGQRGKPVQPKTLNRIWRNLTNKVEGLSHVTIHDARRSFLNDNAPHMHIRNLMGLAGWTNIKSALAYLDKNQAQQTEGIEKASAIRKAAIAAAMPKTQGGTQ